MPATRPITTSAATLATDPQEIETSQIPRHSCRKLTAPASQPTAGSSRLVCVGLPTWTCAPVTTV